MAAEITVVCSAKFAKNSAGVDSTTGSAAGKSHDMAGDDGSSATQVVTTAADVALSIPAEVNPVGLLLVENLDPTNYLQLSTGTGGGFASGVFAKLRPGHRALFQPTTTIYAKANTADLRIKKTVIEE